MYEGVYMVYFIGLLGLVNEMEIFGKVRSIEIVIFLWGCRIGK